MSDFQQHGRLSSVAPIRDGEEMAAKAILSPGDTIAAAEAATDEMVTIVRTAAGTAHPGLTLNRYGYVKAAP